ncbi:MAG: dihydroorotase [Betaproteobacteria bacterium]|nr:dihydroorotase [Betaproteobacteria bacterium]
MTAAPRILIEGGHLIDPANGVDRPGDLAIAHGQIVGVGAAPAGFVVDERIDARGCVVAPGLVDVCARVREPGYEHEGMLASELAAAAAGGVAHLVCPPDTDPPLDEPGLVEMLQYRARAIDRAHLHPLGALTRGLRGAELTEMVQLRQAGCVAFSQAGWPVPDTQVLLRALQYAATHGCTVWLRPQDAWLGKGGVAASGPVATRLGLAGVPVAAETVALFTLFELVRATGCRLHVDRLSSARGVQLVREAKAEGLPVTSSVSLHNLRLIDVDVGYFDSAYRLDPVLRGQRDRDALAAGLADGTIDALCSDHTPVERDAKLLPFAEAEPGATALELLLPQALAWAQGQRLPIERAIEVVTSRAAAVAGLRAGSLAVAGAADVVVFDPTAAWRVTADALVSHGKCTPFAGYEVTGQVRCTVIDGHTVHRAR